MIASRTYMDRSRARWLSPLRRGVAVASLLSSFGVFVITPVAAQPRLLSPSEAVALSMTTHPALRTSDARERRARAEMSAAESALLPSLDVGVELHRATGNVVPGTQLLLPGVPSVSGPPIATAFDGGAWGTGIGVSTAFDVGAFPRRERERDAAAAALDARLATSDAVRLEIAARVVSAYLDLVAAIAQRASIAAWHERAATLLRVTEALVAQDLRPGAEEARARAEVATARALDARAHQTELLARVALASAIGDPSLEVEVDASLLDDTSFAVATADRAAHALTRARRAEIESARLTREARDLAFIPRIELTGAFWARGSGLDAPARMSELGDAAGLLPNVPNWSLGVVVSYPLLDLPLLEARVEEAEARVDEASAALDAQTLELAVLEARGLARLEGARGVAAAAADVVASFEAALGQALARFEAGLTTILDVVDAQRALAQALIEDVTARADLVRAFYDLAYVRGDLSAFEHGQGD